MKVLVCPESGVACCIKSIDDLPGITSVLKEFDAKIDDGLAFKSTVWLEIMHARRIDPNEYCISFILGFNDTTNPLAMIECLRIVAHQGKCLPIDEEEPLPSSEHEKTGQYIVDLQSNDKPILYENKDQLKKHIPALYKLLYH